MQTGTQEFDNIYATPTFWNGTIYYHCAQDVVKAYYWIDEPLRAAAVHNRRVEGGTREKGKGCDLGYALAVSSCERVRGVEACTVTAFDAITAFAVPNPG